MPFTEKVALGPYRERRTLKKWLDGEDIETAEPYATMIVSIWYDEYNNEIIDPLRIQELEDKYPNL